MNGRTLRKDLVRLEAKHPAAYPAIIKVGKLPPEDRGYCGKVKRRGKTYFLLTIAAGMTDFSQRETLVHEYAHALDWRSERQETGRDRHHCDAWGVWYARAFRAAFDESG